MSRKKARDNAFKCVYELEFGMNENIDKILENCYEENNNKPDEKEYMCYDLDRNECKETNDYQ